MYSPFTLLLLLHVPPFPLHSRSRQGWCHHTKIYLLFPPSICNYCCLHLGFSYLSTTGFGHLFAPSLFCFRVLYRLVFFLLQFFFLHTPDILVNPAGESFSRMHSRGKSDKQTSSFFFVFFSKASAFKVITPFLIGSRGGKLKEIMLVFNRCLKKDWNETEPIWRFQDGIVLKNENMERRMKEKQEIRKKNIVERERLVEKTECKWIWVCNVCSRY